ncbi:MAG: site-specific integrase [Lachnospiraceae bacterium]|nr:site-specific integrase [Lachnospiraceae bacterium]
MASIENRNGNYKITVYVGKDANGKQIFKKTTFHPTEKTPKKIEDEVRKFADAFEEKVRNGEYFDGNNLTLNEFVKVWDDKWARKNLTLSVREGYLKILENRVLKKIGHIKLSKIQTESIESIYDEMEEKGLAPATIRRTNVAINSVMSFAYRRKYIKENPCDRLELPKLKKKTTEDIHYFTPSQAKVFLEELKKEQTYTYSASERMIKSTGTEYHVNGYQAHKTVQFQFQVFFTLAIYSGARRGELIALTWKDIDFENRTISINKAFAHTQAQGQLLKETKTTAGNRVLDLPSKCFEMLSTWKDEEKKLSMILGSKWEGYRGDNFDENFVFIQVDNGKAMYLDTVTSKFKKVIKQYNDNCTDEKDKLPDIHLHDLRHTCASILIANNTPITKVSEHLGHSRTSVTLDIYSHWIKKNDRIVSDALEKAFRDIV